MRKSSQNEKFVNSLFLFILKILFFYFSQYEKNVINYFILLIIKKINNFHNNI